MNRVVISLVLIGAAAAGAFAWNASREKVVAVELVSVKRGDVFDKVSNTRAGTVNTCNRARLSPVQSGLISALPVREGDRVKAGDVLLELWNADALAQLQLTQNERKVASARAEEVCSAASVAVREADRFKELFLQNLVSEETLDFRDGDAKAKVAACRAMQHSVEVSDAQIAFSQARMDQTTIRAPFSGIIASINGEVGEIVTPSPVGVVTLPAIDLIDTSCMFVTAPIDEVDAPGITAGMKSRISLDAFPDQTFSATVRRVAPFVEYKEKQARTVDIEVEFDELSSSLLPGYSADVEVTIDMHRNALYIPTQAVINNTKVMLINESGILEERLIKTGIVNWQVSEVMEGLTEADQVVLSVDREGVVPGVRAVVDSP